MDLWDGICANSTLIRTRGYGLHNCFRGNIHDPAVSRRQRLEGQGTGAIMLGRSCSTEREVLPLENDAAGFEGITYVVYATRGTGYGRPQGRPKSLHERSFPVRALNRNSKVRSYDTGT